MENNIILNNLDNPEELERIYRTNRKDFENGFLTAYPIIADKQIADFWKIRLKYDIPEEKITQVPRADFLFLIVSCAIAAFLIKLPAIINIDPAFPFFEKNAAIIVFFGLTSYAIFSRRLSDIKTLLITLGTFLITALYINLLPSAPTDVIHSIDLAYIHLPLLLWGVYGLIFINYDLRDKPKRIDYIRYTGDMAILLAIISISGVLLLGVTFALFSAIDINIDNIYSEYVIIWGFVSAPIVAAYVIRNFPSTTNKIAPIIANIFSPLVLITLIIYLLTISILGKDPYNDRDFLLIFNMMLIGVMALIVFSVTETSVHKRQKFNEMILLLLAVVTFFINLIALSAIVYRLGEYGFSPNKTAVLGANLLIFIHLVLIMIDLYRVNFKNNDIKKVEKTVARYLPVYFIWIIIVVFGFPWIFSFQ